MSLLLPAVLVSPTAASAAEGRVISGNVVSPADVTANGRWGAVVAIFATDAQGTRLCTGTLIAPNWVATAAHCLAQSNDATKALAPADVFVAPGITSVASAGDHLIGAVSTVVHPGFSWSNASWDAALIELESTVPATPVSLPDPRTPDAYSIGSADNVAGFGRSQASNSASSGTLRSGRLEQVNAAACGQYNPDSVGYADCYLPGPTRQATCFGDSGGPLMRFDAAGRPVLWGITSTGPDPCDAATGGAFAPAFETRVIAVADWINATRTGSTFVPSPGGTSRTAGSVSPGTGSASGVAGPGLNKTAKSPVGGTGIGIFQSKVNRVPSAKKTGLLTLSASFVGATGKGTIEIERCAKQACRIVARSAMTFSAAGSTVVAKVKVPRCAKKATLTLRLSVTDASGVARDTASQRIVKCK
ncbi:MAG: trypsin-like serine protease [Solirubrobacteraceae bacterium]|nr:trypsin-like serine protease [Solirubrobacteraceae bacterium]